MINPNILKVLESTLQDPSYSVMITKFQQVDSYCNKDKLIITTEQVNPNVFKLIENKENIIELLTQTLVDNNIEIPDFNEIFVNTITEKQLSIESLLDYDINTSMFISALTGDLNNEKNKNLTSPFVKGTIINGQTEFVDKDYPNYFNQNRFKVKNNSLIITVPKKVETIEFKITQYTKPSLMLFIEKNIIQKNEDVSFRAKLLNASGKPIQGQEIDFCTDVDIATDEVIKTIYTEADMENNKITIPIHKEYNYTFDLSYTLKNDITTKSIESITTPLEPKIDVEFSNIYSSLPAIIPTIDEDNKIYSSYTLSFDTNEDNHYTGVSITFKNFKKTKTRGDINITVIGDKID